MSTMSQDILDYLHSHWQPWVKRDIKTILDERTIAAVRDGPYVGIHVRRGDKLIREAKSHGVQVHPWASNQLIFI